MAALRAMAAQAVRAGINAFGPQKWPRDSRAYWTKAQNVFAHRLRADPVGQIRHVRSLWRDRRRGKIPTDSELFKCMDVLGERFVNPQEYCIARTLACYVDEDLGPDFWEACVQTEFLGFLVEIVTDSEFSIRPRVRKRLIVLPNVVLTLLGMDGVCPSVLYWLSICLVPGCRPSIRASQLQDTVVQQAHAKGPN